MVVIPVVIGQRFGRLTVISEPVGVVKWKQKVKVCMARCDCGKEKEVVLTQIFRGIVKSCGCLFTETLITRSYKNGMFVGRNKCKESRVWSGMLSRCYSVNETHYPSYGGRGITVCDRWRESFENFLEDMGRIPSPTHTIDRIDVNGNYEPSNCKWATPLEQGNNKRNNVWLEFNGENRTLSQWARKLNMRYSTFYREIVYKGKTIDQLIKAA